MDAISLATVTAALTVMASEFGKGTLSAAGGDVWTKVKSLFGWKEQPPPAELAPAMAGRLQKDAQLAKDVVQLLQHQAVGSASAFAGSLEIHANRVTVTNIGKLEGGLRIDMGD